jgi:hypothetical protein
MMRKGESEPICFWQKDIEFYIDGNDVSRDVNDILGQLYLDVL